MADPAGDDEKARLRKAAHATRAALDDSYRAQAAIAVAETFFRTVELSPGDVVAGYWRIRSELDCQPILLRLMDSGQTVVLPVVVDDLSPLDLRVWEPYEPLYEAGFGTLAPSDLAPRAEPDVVLVPLLAFDAAGTRLGYGGGYYDRTLARLAKRPKLVGLAFAAQEMPHIPRQPHDQPLDAVITENGVRFFEHFR